MTLPKDTTPDFARLLNAYKKAVIDFPQLKAFSFAQWALECGFGTSNLARDHLNFGGAKWRPYMNGWSTPVSYKAHDGETLYCKFPDHQAWINGYWGRFDKEPAYKGWRNHVADGATFMNFIGPIWLGMGKEKGDEYVRKVTSIHDKCKLADIFSEDPNNASRRRYTLAELRKLFPDRV